MRAASTGRTHSSTRPICTNVILTLANGPSSHFRSLPPKADIDQSKLPPILANGIKFPFCLGGRCREPVPVTPPPGVRPLIWH